MRADVQVEREERDSSHDSGMNESICQGSACEGRKVPWKKDTTGIGG